MFISWILAFRHMVLWKLFKIISLNRWDICLSYSISKRPMKRIHSKKDQISNISPIPTPAPSTPTLLSTKSNLHAFQSLSFDLISRAHSTRFRPSSSACARANSFSSNSSSKFSSERSSRLPRVDGCCCCCCCFCWLLFEDDARPRLFPPPVKAARPLDRTVEKEEC